MGLGCQCIQASCSSLPCICCAQDRVVCISWLMCCLCFVQRTLDSLIDRGDISSRDLDDRTMDALEGRQPVFCSSAWLSKVQSASQSDAGLWLA